MNKERTWRDLLGELIRAPQERRRVARELGIQPLTLLRWVKGQSNPRQDSLRLLPTVLPHQREQLGELIARDYPALALLQKGTEDNMSPEISAAFYDHVFATLAKVPGHLRGWSICKLVVEQLLHHLDPHGIGMGVTIAQCVPPSPGKKVRSFRQTLGSGTGRWQDYLERNTQFLGAESRIGKAIMTGSPVVVHNTPQQVRMYPSHSFPALESALTYPVMQSDRVAGCLGMFSSLPNYFTQARLDLVGRYVALLSVAFSRDEFYALQDIDLKIMPSCEKQRPVLAQFQQEVTQRMLQATSARQPLSRTEAEVQVWQEIEECLIHMALAPDRSMVG